MTWLDAVGRGLDRAGAPVTVFFRDDDAGWADERLETLLDVFARHGAPIDLAVIPEALDAPLAARLRDRRAAAGGLVGLHQHGLSHRNHEVEGRKCEFGPSRPPGVQRADIEHGRRLLADLLGPDLDPIFTPPWNRCTPDTGAALAELGLVLSRDATAAPLGIAALRELPIAIDWFAHRKGERIARAELGERIAERLGAPGPVGIMLHHAVMEHEDMSGTEELVALLAGHPAASLRTMGSLASEGDGRKEEPGT